MWRRSKTDSHGRVVPLEEPEIASRPTKRGYRRVSLGKRVIYEHLLVYALFNGLASLREVECIDHINANKGDNRIENLEGVTLRENSRRAERMGLVRRTYGELNGCCKLSTDEVQEIRKRYASGEKQHQLAKLFRIRQGTVSDIVNHKRRRYG